MLCLRPSKCAIQKLMCPFLRASQNEMKLVFQQKVAEKETKLKQRCVRVSIR